MYVLDTDHMSLLEWGGEGSAQLRERLADLENDQLATTIMSYEEQIRGWTAFDALEPSDLPSFPCTHIHAESRWAPSPAVLHNPSGW
jgi:hypothetical protein